MNDLKRILHELNGRTLREAGLDRCTVIAKEIDALNLPDESEPLARRVGETVRDWANDNADGDPEWLYRNLRDLLAPSPSPAANATIRNPGDAANPSPAAGQEKGLTVEQARERGVCRLCGLPAIRADGGLAHGPFRYNFGKEYAHECCLSALARAPEPPVPPATVDPKSVSEIAAKALSEVHGLCYPFSPRTCNDPSCTCREHKAEVAAAIERHRAKPGDSPQFAAPKPSPEGERGGIEVVAKDIAARLFMGGDGRKACRIVLEYDGGSLNGPGWCEAAVVDQVIAALSREGGAA